ncbi:hypothetical protein [Pseudomonas sp. W5-01]|uniref:hypothetical protein n=1 Tax=Pseudomonas sp. W5-01 TaxID=3097454 RepID=UPI0039783ACB
MNTDNLTLRYFDAEMRYLREAGNRFFALYADIHLFTQITLILQPTGRSLRWSENHSQRIPG